MASLRELQHSFAAALRDPSAPCAVRPPANLAVYRNNSAHFFRAALEISFPVVRRRVGDDYFRQLAFHYRQQHPSRSGDLQWVGRQFPEFLATHLAGGDYAWLADLAALEWRCELAAIAELVPALEVHALAGQPSASLEDLRFTLQPSLQLHQSTVPVFSVWLANQVENAPPVDQSLGSEQGMVLQRSEGVVVRPLPRPVFLYLDALLQGATLGDAVNIARIDEAGLLDALRFQFGEGLVCAVSQSAKR
jgi:hypothetical protein